ncbi:putative nuclease HARBI1 [Mercenaria mercenaria]|uniref:putative nuclease HARBI1 n=1 Tax=Mercenaria mercenaria TaxID=6596 RepID=UPI001E1E10B8|nr:putative nuclease HARBI1 [Mercenaria mercenaria]
MSMHMVIEALDAKLNNINFPRTAASLATMKRKFFNITRIPNCIGAIDSTLITILAPKVREDIFVCRKGYHAINVQAVVDPDMRLVDVVAQWPGSTHDSTIFESCGLKARLETGNHGWLIGDSGYALKPYLVTPKIRPSTRQENAFNTAHSRTRMVVERTFGLLKSHFR